MDKKTALECLEIEATALRQRPFDELRQLIDNPRSKYAQGSDGKQYQIELNAFWDQSREDGNLRLVISIDDGRSWWRLFMPMTKTLIARPDGSFF